jgi:hypothetical protein
VSGPFSRTSLWVVIGVAAASLAAAAALTIFGENLGGDTASGGADSYSRSALGHRALFEILERLDVPVVRSRSDSASKARHGLLVIVAPSIAEPAARERLSAMLAEAPRALLVLPKWSGSQRRGEPWIAAASLLPVSRPQAVLDEANVQGQVIRAALAEQPWIGEEAWSVRPQLRDPQVLDRSELDSVVASDAGLLVGYTRVGDARDLWVLADPDPISNFGLADPANARFAIELIDRLRDGGPVVIDEVVHGYAQAPSLLRTLFRFPLVLATLQGLICALLAVWAAMVRFGPRRAPPPPLAPGKDFLIQNTAALLHYGGHHADALRRYLAQSVSEVRLALHAPALAPGAVTAWLEDVRRHRGGTVSLLELERDAAAAETPHHTLEVADRVYRWRMEMTDGAHRRP